MKNLDKNSDKKTSGAITLERQAIDAANQLVEMAYQTIEQALKAGSLLNEFKSENVHGGWTKWVNENLNIGIRQCQKLMKIAKYEAIIRKYLKANPDSFLTIDGAGRVINEELKPDVDAETSVDGEKETQPEKEKPVTKKELEEQIMELVEENKKLKKELRDSKAKATQLRKQLKEAGLKPTI